MTKSVSVYYRNGTVFIVPQLGITDIGPVFTTELDEDAVSAGLRNALAVNPAEQVMPATGSDYRSPVLAAMNVKSNVAFERGLKLGVLRLAEPGYQFFRFIQPPQIKSGFRRDDNPIFTMPADAPVSAIAAKVVKALDDESWPMKKSRFPITRRR